MYFNHIIEKLLKLKNWKDLNTTQAMAVKEGLLSSNNNLVIVAPTASGKTGVALLAALQTLESGGRVLYLVPMISLIADKERDFKGISNKLAGLNSSPSDWDKADVVVTTFESFYRTALLSPTHAQGFSLAIIDEFHVLYDRFRGFNLEKVITILKEMIVRIICLSATFEDKGSWQKKTRKYSHGIVKKGGNPQKKDSARKPSLPKPQRIRRENEKTG